jgi:hypothetical protein|tara:strand:+ start:182 stop:670 length:489 start_codon:yes stop_codon:yes gene_type:complete
MQNPRIDGIDWRSLQKGDIIPKEHILDYWNIFFPDKEWDRFSMLEVKENVMKLREGINKPIVLKEVKESLVVLTDKDAVDYSAKQANAGIKKHRKHTRRMFTHIDTNNLDEAKKRDLETKQITHAFIASAAAGARKESLDLQKKGQRLPKGLVDLSDFKKPS